MFTYNFYINIVYHWLQFLLKLLLFNIILHWTTFFYIILLFLVSIQFESIFITELFKKLNATIVNSVGPIWPHNGIYLYFAYSNKVYLSFSAYNHQVSLYINICKQTIVNNNKQSIYNTLNLEFRYNHVYKILQLKKITPEALI